MIKKSSVRQQAAAVMRALNMSSKFLVVFFGAKYLELQEMAFLGLYWTIVTICASVIGLNIYTYTIRKALSHGEQLVSRELSRHYTALICLTLISAPFFITYSHSLFSGDSLILFPILMLHVFAEVMSQENSRFLIAFGKPFESSLANFVRGFLWSLFAILYLIVFNYEASFLTVITIWLLFSIISLVYSARLIQVVLNIKLKWDANFSWVCKSVYSAGWILVASLLFRVVVGGDRLIAEWFLDESLLAVYVYYSILVFALVGIVETGVSSWHYPELVKAIGENNFHIVNEKYRQYQSAIVLPAFGMVVLLNMTVILSSRFFLDNIYFDNYLVFTVLSLGALVYSLAMPSHYVIYGLGRDRCYFFICASSVLLFLVAVFLLPVNGAIYRVAIAFFLALSFLSLLKYSVARKFRQAFN